MLSNQKTLQQVSAVNSSQDEVVLISECVHWGVIGGHGHIKTLLDL